jgi:hypothetical protein
MHAIAQENVQGEHRMFRNNNLTQEDQMKSGLLWYDNGKKPIWDKIEDAARRYKDKFGTAPDTCYVNPGDLDQASGTKPGLKLQVSGKTTVMPNHIWLGVSK